MTTIIEQTTQQKIKGELIALTEYFSKPQNNLPAYIAASFLKTYGKPSDKWSLNNKMIQLVLGQTEDARTYNQWQAVGRQVVKGQKAFFILAPNQFKIAQEDKNGNVEEKTILAGFRGIAVFADSQTKGKEVKYVEEPKQLPPLMEVAKKMGLKIKYDKTIHGEGGSYNQMTDEIRLCTADMGTFFHELAHAVHKRIDGKLKGGQDVEQEVIAEFTSCVIAAAYGYDKKSNAYNYIKSYSQDKNKIGEHVLKVLSKVEKILNYIFKIEN